MDNSSTIFDESKWLSFKKNLKKNVGESAFNNWLKHLNYVSVDETTITFSVPTKFSGYIHSTFFGEKNEHERSHLIQIPVFH